MMRIGSQKTVSSPVRFTGKGLHTGTEATITVFPAVENTGILFRKSKNIPADYRYVSETRRSVTLSHHSESIQTVEHLLAALYGTGVANAVIEVHGPELPILDGSAFSFAEKLLKTGLTVQSAERKIMTVRESFVYRNPETGAKLECRPAPGLTIRYHLLKNGSVLQSVEYEHTEGSFLTEIAPARTFAFLSELKKLKENHLIMGAQQDSGFITMDEPMNLKEIDACLAIPVLSEQVYPSHPYPVLSAEKPRFPDEMARHKIADLLGDFSLSGHFFRGFIEAWGTGHADHVAAVSAICR